MGITLSQAGPGGIPFRAGDDAETEMLDGDSSITTITVQYIDSNFCICKDMSALQYTPDINHYTVLSW